MARNEYSENRRINEDTNQPYWVCLEPDCADPEPPNFNYLQAFKQHMQKEHGGLVESSESSEAPRSDDTQKGAGAEELISKRGTPAPKPKKLSIKARELNNKFNRCISLCIKHMFKELSEEERIELESLRAEISENVIGVEFDFDDKLVGISGKWALIVALALLYTLPALPSLRDIIRKSKEVAEAKKAEK